MSELHLPAFGDCLPALGQGLAEHGCQSLILVDATALASVEEDYGIEAFEQVRTRLHKTILEMKTREYREADLVATDTPRGLRFLFFLERKRRKGAPTSGADLRHVRGRFMTGVVPTLLRAAFPYAGKGTRLTVGYGTAVANPLLHVERTLHRLIDEATEQAALERRLEELQLRERLIDLLVRDRVVTAYQPIVRMEDRTVLGFEALSRGPRGSGLEGAEILFGTATQQNLLMELDRLCRRRALLSSGRIPTNALIFVNTLPATIRDPHFRGKALIDFLQRAQVSPDRIVIEITEGLVIQNYSLFREAMDYYIALGISFAVDDVGAGYSGLESIARLKPSFLKIDMGLVRDVHSSMANREIVRAIQALGQGIGAGVIAEGISSEDEFKTLSDMGIEFGQGFLLGRPDPGPEPA